MELLLWTLLLWKLLLWSLRGHGPPCRPWVGSLLWRWQARRDHRLRWLRDDCLVRLQALHAILEGFESVLKCFSCSLQFIEGGLEFLHN